MLGDISGRFSLLPLALVLLASGAGCGGCNDSNLVCDDAGNCQICDGYGCTPADSGPGGAGSGAGGSGAAGSGAASSGGAGTGADGTGAEGSGGEGAGGAANPCDPTLTTCGCDPNAEPDPCTDGTQCIDGLCLEGCNHSFECGDDMVCANGLCVEGCDDDDDPCASAYMICENGVCVVDPQNPECEDQTDCEPQICEGGLCVDPCEVNEDCATGEVCNAGSGTCFPDPSPAPMCDENTTCPGLGQVCWADGFCRYPCGTVNECKLIDARFDHCDAGVCKTELELNPECDLDTPCPSGEDCISNKCL